MNCDDYLAMLETLPVDELAHGDAREHAAVCRDCNRVTRVVAERERNMLIAYGDVMPSSSAIAIAESAMLTARRRRTVSRYTIGIALAALVALVLVINDGMFRRRVILTNSVEQIFTPNCISSALAAEVVGAAMSDQRDTKLVVRNGVLIVTGTPQAIQTARSTVDQYESQCRINKAR